MDFAKKASAVAQGYEGALKRKYDKKAEGTQWDIDPAKAKDFSKGASEAGSVDWENLASLGGLLKKKKQ